MQLTLIQNSDQTTALAYRIARVVYAQTVASSLSVVEALTSMINNLSQRSGIPISEIITDKNIFDVLDEKSESHNLLNVYADNRAFQMCVRVATRMLSGGLCDSVFGATRFHHVSTIPVWAQSLGYIADIDGLLFYV